MNMHTGIVALAIVAVVLPLFAPQIVRMLEHSPYNHLKSSTVANWSHIVGSLGFWVLAIALLFYGPMHTIIWLIAGEGYFPLLQRQIEKL